MSQAPRRDEPTLNLEVASAEELERMLITVSFIEFQQKEEEFTPPPPNRRCDSAHREILRHPFLLER